MPKGGKGDKVKGTGTGVEPEPEPEPEPEQDKEEYGSDDEIGGITDGSPDPEPDDRRGYVGLSDSPAGDGESPGRSERSHIFDNNDGSANPDGQDDTYADPFGVSGQRLTEVVVPVFTAAPAARSKNKRKSKRKKRRKRKTKKKTKKKSKRKTKNKK